MKATAAGGRTGGVMRPPVHLLEGLAGDAEAVDRRRHAAINGGLQEHFGDLRLRDAVADRALDVELELVRTVQSRDHGEVEEAAGAAVEAWPPPDLAPAIFGDELLHGAVEIVGGGDRAVDVVAAEHRTADLQARLEQIIAHRTLSHTLPKPARTNLAGSPPYASPGESRVASRARPELRSGRFGPQSPRCGRRTSLNR